MKILIIANGYPDEWEPQFGCFERDQAIALANLGHNVSIMYVDRRFRFYWRHIGIIRNNFQFYSVYGLFYFPLGWLLNIFTYKIYYHVVKRLFNKLYNVYCKENGSPDIIYAHYIWNIAYAASLKDINKTPLVGIEHWSGMTSQALSRIARFYGEIAYSNADELLAVSQSLQSHIKRHFGKDSTVVYDMLGLDFISAQKASCSDNIVNDRNIFSFVSIGSLIRRKGFDLLLEAFAESNLVEKGCRIIIIGGGPEQSYLKLRSDELGIKDSVVFVGRKSKTEIIKILSESQVFVLSSRAETFGVVCIEALSQGLPNIATICGGPEEFINDNNGILIPVEDISAMSKAMCDMYNNYSTYNKKAIAEECKQKFAPNVIAQQLTVIFENVIEK